MAWSLEGTYFENCNCDAICPCTWSGLSEHATHDRCRVVLNYHIDRGAIDGVDVSGLTFALVADTPPVMTDGNWRVGVLVDDRATAEQTERLGAVISGQHGGPPAILHPLVGEFLGIQAMPVSYADEGRRHRAQWGDAVTMEVEDFVSGPMAEPVQLQHVFHPSNSTLTVAKAVNSQVSAFGIDFGQVGTNGCSAPYSWRGE